MNLGFSFMNGLSVHEQIIIFISLVHVPFIVRSSELWNTHSLEDNIILLNCPFVSSLQQHKAGQID